MHRHTLAPLALTAAVVIVAATTGCATSKPAPPPIFYPATQPRVQFLLGFMDVDRWVEKRSSLAQFVMGTTEQVSHEIKSPYGMAIRNGRMYICDLGLHCVHVVDLAARTYSRLGTPQQVLNPVHVTLAPDGTKYVCDTDPKHNAVVVFDAQDKYVRDIVPPEGTRIIDVALYKDELIVADIDGGHVLAWDRDGKLLRQIAGPGEGPSQLRRPTNLAIGPDGTVFVTDTDLQVVKVFKQDGTFVRIIGVPGDRPGNFARPKGIAVDPEERVYVADAQWGVIQLFTAEGQILLDIPEQPADAVRDALKLPAGLTIDTTSLPYFQQFVAPGFVPEYLLFACNQYRLEPHSRLRFRPPYGSPGPRPCTGGLRAGGRAANPRPVKGLAGAVLRDRADSTAGRPAACLFGGTRSRGRDRTVTPDAGALQRRRCLPAEGGVRLRREPRAWGGQKKEGEGQVREDPPLAPCRAC